jgi:hypothetical protein
MSAERVSKHFIIKFAGDASQEINRRVSDERQSSDGCSGGETKFRIAFC